jgi:hypothetical protein
LNKSFFLLQNERYKGVRWNQNDSSLPDDKGAYLLKNSYYATVAAARDGPVYSMNNWIATWLNLVSPWQAAH